MKCQLHSYQEYSVDWILEKNHSGVFQDMGLGKTLTTLTAIDYLFKLEQIKKVLVIAPLNVAKQTWSDEIAKWDHLQHLTYSKVIGSPKQRLEALDREADIYITNIDVVTWLVDHYLKDWPFDMVVVDELSGFKTAVSKRFRALRKVRPKFKRFVGLTGTPAPNSLMDLWSQMYLIDGGERLEQNISKYRRKYFTPDKMNGHIVYSYKLIPGSDELIYEKIEDVAISMKSSDYLEMPELIVNDIEIELDGKSKKQYDTFERDYVLSLGEGELVAANAAVLSGKLQQLANGAIYDEDKKVIEVHDEKLTVLERIVDEAQGKPIIVFYWFQHDRDRILKRFKQAKVLEVNDGDVAKWNAGEIPILLAHPASAGHGLNLQKGSNTMVWFSMTWSLELYQQAVARLYRQGQTEQTVIMHRILVKGTEDIRARRRLETKDRGQNELIEAVKAKIEEASKH